MILLALLPVHPPTLAFLDQTFLGVAQSDPVRYVSWVVTVLVSVVLHELGHGVAALSQGDETPRATGHMTLNPLVHMGGFSLVLLFVVGIAWGMMPVNPSRFRSRHGDALVAFAGPAVNLVLAFLGLTALALILRFGGEPTSDAGFNFLRFLEIFGVANIVLFLLNMIPIPPLDGSRVVASFVKPYARIAEDPNNQGVFFAVFILVFLGAGYLFAAAYQAAGFWVTLIVGA